MKKIERWSEVSSNLGKNNAVGEEGWDKWLLEFLNFWMAEEDRDMRQNISSSTENFPTCSLFNYLFLSRMLNGMLNTELPVLLSNTKTEPCLHTIPTALCKNQTNNSKR